MASRGQGERAGLSRSLILDAAVALVDREGLDGLSMRKLGGALGVEAMTLYHYVPNKAALLDGLVEWVMQHSATAPALADGLSWDRVLRRYAETLRTTLLGHPGVLPLFFTHPAVTPQTLKAVENGLRVLTEAGFAVVSRSWKRSIICTASWRDLPLTLSVIKDADAVEIAQPAPTKLTS